MVMPERVSESPPASYPRMGAGDVGGPWITGTAAMALSHWALFQFQRRQLGMAGYGSFPEEENVTYFLQYFTIVNTHFSIQ